jgi:hypothetical protein
MHFWRVLVVYSITFLLLCPNNLQAFSVSRVSTLSTYLSNQAELGQLRDEMFYSNNFANKKLEDISRSSNVPTVQYMEDAFDDALYHLKNGREQYRDYERLSLNKQSVFKQHSHLFIAHIRALENMALIFEKYLKAKSNDPEFEKLYAKYSDYVFRESGASIVEQGKSVEAAVEEQSYTFDEKLKSDLFRHLTASILNITYAYDGPASTTEEFAEATEKLCGFAFYVYKGMRVDQEQFDLNRKRMAYMLSELIYALRKYGLSDSADAMTDRWITRLELSEGDAAYFIQKGYKYYAKPVFKKEKALKDRSAKMQDITQEDISDLLDALDVFAVDFVPDKHRNSTTMLLSLYRFLTEYLFKKLQAYGLEDRLNDIYKKLMARYPEEERAPFSLRVEKKFFVHPAYVKAREVKNAKKIEGKVGYSEIISALKGLEGLKASLNYDEMRIAWAEIAPLYNHFAKEIANYAMGSQASDVQKQNYFHQAYHLLRWNDMMFLEYGETHNKHPQLPHILNAYNYVNYCRLNSSMSIRPLWHTDDQTWYANNQINLIRYGLTKAREVNGPYEERAMYDQLFKLWRNLVNSALQLSRANDPLSAYRYIKIAHDVYAEFKNGIDERAQDDYKVRCEKRKGYELETEHFLHVYEYILVQIKAKDRASFDKIVAELINEKDATSIKFTNVFAGDRTDIDRSRIGLCSA